MALSSRNKRTFLLKRKESLWVKYEQFDSRLGLLTVFIYFRVDQATIDREQAGLGADDAMEVELDPLTLLEMGMGEDNIEIEVRKGVRRTPTVRREVGVLTGGNRKRSSVR
jgi:hypothetical protein